MDDYLYQSADRAVYTSDNLDHAKAFTDHQRGDPTPTPALVHQQLWRPDAPVVVGVGMDASSHQLPAIVGVRDLFAPSGD